jgi:hypothetical protein
MPNVKRKPGKTHSLNLNQNNGAYISYGADFTFWKYLVKSGGHYYQTFLL